MRFPVPISRLLRVLAAGAVLAGSSSALAPARLPPVALADGAAPAYRWVRPPLEFSRGNHVPAPGIGYLDLPASGSPAASVVTGDGQAFLNPPGGAFGPQAGQRSVYVLITPLAPESLGPPPAGLRFVGNGYRIEAAYVPSRRPAALQRPATVVLTFPLSATSVLRWSGSAWVGLASRVDDDGFRVSADVDELGTFVAAGPPHVAARPPAEAEGGFPWTAVLGAVAAVAAAGAAALLVMRRLRTRPGLGAQTNSATVTKP